MLTRRQDWPELLAAFFTERRLQTFAWGVHDCCLFACDAVLAITGEDIAEGLRGKYKTEHGAAKLLKSCSSTTGDKTVEGVEAIAEIIAGKFQVQECALLMAQRGDVVLFEALAGGGENSRPTLGVVSMHGHTAVSVSPAGTVEIAIDKCKRAWRIG